MADQKITWAKILFATLLERKGDVKQVAHFMLDLGLDLAFNADMIGKSIGPPEPEPAPRAPSPGPVVDVSAREVKPSAPAEPIDDVVPDPPPEQQGKRSRVKLRKVV